MENLLSTYSNQITSITIIDFDSFGAKVLAFMKMGLLPFFIKGRGLQEFRLMGSGADSGFGAKPNFGRYAFIGIWESRESSEEYFRASSLWSFYLNGASHHKTYWLKNTMAHGLWGGKNPFEKGSDHDPSSKVAVITRATIKWSHMLNFWKHVPASSAGIHNKEGLIFAIGIGEWPMRFQATFSIWENSEYMKKYAYESKQHTDMIKMTKQVGWYKEELFARFALVD
jgi:hypothetical protein